MVKFPEAQARLYRNIFVFRKCKTRQRAQPQKVLKKKMNWDLILLLIFFLVVYIFYLTNKKKFEVQGRIFFLYRTKFGLKLMDKFSKKSPKTLNVVGIVGVIVS